MKRAEFARCVARWAAFKATALALAGCGGGVALAPGALVDPSHHDAPADPAANAVVAFAAAQVGHPYCWGGTGPRCFDCSGLTMTAWRQVGVGLPRTADAMAEALPPVALEDIRPGDVLWWPGHVGIYAGNGWTIEALNAKSGVVWRRAATPKRAFRPVAAAGMVVQSSDANTTRPTFFSSSVAASRSASSASASVSRSANR